MPVIIDGVHGTYVGNQDAMFDASNKVKEAVEACKNLSSKWEFIRKLQSDESLKKKYCDAFEFLYMLNDFTEEQRNCYRLLKKYF